VERVMFTGTTYNVFVRLASGREVRAALSEGASRGIESGAAVELCWSGDDVIVVEHDADEAAG
jgi:hypothetical protein